MNRFVRRFLSIFSFLFFVFSLRIAEAKGVATILTVVAVVALVVLSAGTLSGALPAVMPGLVAPGATFVGYAAGALGVTALVGMAVGQIQCLAGQDSVWFEGCSEGGGAPSGWTGEAGSPIVTYEDIQCGCDYCNLTYDYKNAYGYAIYKQVPGESEAKLLVSHKYGVSTSTRLTYSDTNLTPHSQYRYVLTLFNASGKQFQYAPLDGYTKCLAQCTFSVDKETIVLPGKATLSWSCVDATACKIDSSQKGEIATNLSLEGSLEVQPEKAEKTTYVLTCQNVDGEASFSVSLDVKEAGYKEVKP